MSLGWGGIDVIVFEAEKEIVMHCINRKMDFNDLLPPRQEGFPPVLFTCGKGVPTNNNRVVVGVVGSQLAD